MMRISAAVAVLFAFASCGWIAAAPPPVVGTWECLSTTPSGTEMKWTLTLKQEGGKLTGTAGTEDRGTMPVDDVKFEGGTLTFRVVVESEPYQIETKVNGDKLEGYWKGAGESGSVKGTRKS